MNDHRLSNLVALYYNRAVDDVFKKVQFGTGMMEATQEVFSAEPIVAWKGFKSTVARIPRIAAPSDLSAQFADQGIYGTDATMSHAEGRILIGWGTYKYNPPLSQTFVAECDGRTVYEAGLPIKTSHTPDPRCMCGFYTTKEKWGWSRDLIYAQVELFGKVLEGDRGYRSSHLRILEPVYVASEIIRLDNYLKCVVCSKKNSQVVYAEGMELNDGEKTAVCATHVIAEARQMRNSVTLHPPPQEESFDRAYGLIGLLQETYPNFSFAVGDAR